LEVYDTRGILSAWERRIKEKGNKKIKKRGGRRRREVGGGKKGKKERK